MRPTYSLSILCTALLALSACSTQPDTGSHVYVAPGAEASVPLTVKNASPANSLDILTFKSAERCMSDAAQKIILGTDRGGLKAGESGATRLAAGQSVTLWTYNQSGCSLMSTFNTRPGYAYAATVSQAGGQCRIEVSSQNQAGAGPSGSAPVAEPSLKTVVNQTKGGNLCLSGKAVSDSAAR